MSINRTGPALTNVWDIDMACSSMQRWKSTCARNNWQWPAEYDDLLMIVFGASWYFTRFIFFQGMQINSIFATDQHDLHYSASALGDSFHKTLVSVQSIEKKFEVLRVLKNQGMLTIFLAQLSKQHAPEEIERELTHLAEVVLRCALNILFADDRQLKENIAVLAMGRMAGSEMNFGSDLDLIFLYLGEDSEFVNKIIRLVRSLMRNMGTLSPAGSLYDMDTRLQPYGNVGALVTSTQSFIDYHQSKRQIWERQMMTRCRIIVDYGDIADAALKHLQHSIYQPFADEILKVEIFDMRKLIIDKLGNQYHKYDLKRGEGGIMDIDFLTHYLQLLHGHDDQSLHVCSTRTVLRKLTARGRLQADDSAYLLQAYDYLKSVELCLRVFDMKAVNSFCTDEHATLNRLAQSITGHSESDIKQAQENFLVEYTDTVKTVRQLFNKVLSV